MSSKLSPEHTPASSSSAAACSSENANFVSPPSGYVGQVKQTWREHEDYALALKLQDSEFCDHYNSNRCERKTVQGDIKLSKEEQKLEDRFAAEYWEQVRLDREKEDERFALEIQKQLEEEDRKKRRQLQQTQSQDEEIAKKMQFSETSAVEQDAALAKRMQELDLLTQHGIRRGPNGVIILPPGITPETVQAIRAAQAEAENGDRCIQLPPGITREHMTVIQQAIKEEDSRLAQEMQDRELAFRLQEKEKVVLFSQNPASEGVQRRDSASSKLPPPRPSPPQFSSSQLPPAANSPSTKVYSSAQQRDLISFDSDCNSVVSPPFKSTAANCSSADLPVLSPSNPFATAYSGNNNNLAGYSNSASSLNNRTPAHNTALSAIHPRYNNLCDESATCVSGNPKSRPPVGVSVLPSNVTFSSPSAAYTSNKRRPS